MLPCHFESVAGWTRYPQVKVLTPVELLTTNAPVKPWVQES